MTLTLRPLAGIVFAALLALSLVATTIDAVASTPDNGSRSGGTALLDRGFVDHATGFFRPRPIGRLGVTWE